MADAVPARGRGGFGHRGYMEDEVDPRGTGTVSAPVPKKLLQMADIEDC